MSSALPSHDVERWYWDEVQRIASHMEQVRSLLQSRVEQLRRPSNAELGFGMKIAGDLRKADRCLSHASRFADFTQRIAVKNPYEPVDSRWSNLSKAGAVLGIVGLVLCIVGLFVLSLSSFWVGLGLSTGGLVLLLIGGLILIESKHVIVAVAAGIALTLFFIAFVTLLVVL